jgi:YidC/Oxa1 family membrane protein insertase
MTAFLFEGPGWLLAKFYDFVPNYIVAISLMALVVMIITAPLQLKATKGMLEMQKLQPEMKKLQQEHRGDRQKLNEEMMKLYQGHKVNPLASCFPLLLQFPVFIVMFRVLHGLTYEVNCALPDLSQGAKDACAVTGATAGKVFDPKFIPLTSRMWDDLHGQSTMMAWGLDLAARVFCGLCAAVFLCGEAAVGDQCVHGIRRHALGRATGGHHSAGGGADHRRAGAHDAHDPRRHPERDAVSLH